MQQKKSTRFFFSKRKCLSTPGEERYILGQLAVLFLLKESVSRLKICKGLFL